MDFTKNIDENKSAIKGILKVDLSFDIIGRELDIADTPAYLVFVDGFAKDDIMIHVMKELQGSKEGAAVSVDKLLKTRIPYIETGREKSVEKTATAVLSGQIALIVDGLDTAIMIDARQYPAREPSESHIEKVTRGPRDDLVETIVFNTALIRRRVRDTGLVFEMKSVGSRSKTDVAVGYIDGQVDKKLLEHIKRKLDSIDIAALTMGEKSLEELLVKKKWYNPLPQVRYSERPDTIAAHLLEGHVVLLVDTSPTAMILPTTLFYFTQYVEDYYQNPLVGTITRFIRLIAFFASMFLIPLFLLINMYPEQTPQMFQFLVPDKTGDISIFMQLILLEFGLEMLKLSSLHTPQNLEAAFSIIGGLILGDFAVTMGIFIADTIFFAIASTIADHCVPNPEMGASVRIFRWLLLLLTGLLGIWGFIAGLIIMIILVFTTKTFDRKRSYTWPLIPFNGKALKHLLFRYPLATLDGKNDQSNL